MVTTEKESMIKQNREIPGDKTSFTGYPSIDKPWMKYYKTDSATLEIPKKSILQYAYERNKDRLSMPALDLRMSMNGFKKTIRSITYGTFFDEVLTAACAFRRLGVQPDEIIGIFLPNLIECREAIYAANALGASVYPMSPMLPEKTVEEIVTQNHLKTVIVFEKFWKKYERVLSGDGIRNIIFVTGLESFPPVKRAALSLVGGALPKDERVLSWTGFVKLGENERKEQKITGFEDFGTYYAEGHIAAIIGTSGTTGTPKGCMFTDFAMNSVFVSNTDAVHDEKSYLDVLMASIAYGFSMMHIGICQGICAFITPELITSEIVKLLTDIRPDIFTGGPIHYGVIAASSEWREGKIKDGYYLSGGATLPREVESKLNRIVNPVVGTESLEKIFVCQGLGATENCGTGINGRLHYKFGGVGIPVYLQDAGIFKPDTDEELSYNEEGEICLSGSMMMQGYLNNSEETAKVIKLHRDGKKWLHLGDLGYVDEDGQFYIVDRIKNIFMRAGFNVHPSRIAEFISSLPMVESAYVMGVPHPDEVTVPVAFVILKDKNGGSDLDEDEIRKAITEACYHNLDEYSLPYEYFFVKEFPRNLGGKVDAGKLVETCGIDYFKTEGRNVNRMELK